MMKNPKLKFDAVVLNSRILTQYIQILRLEAIKLICISQCLSSFIIPYAAVVVVCSWLLFVGHFFDLSADNASFDVTNNLQSTQPVTV